jgi:hypothetical protein
MSPDLLRLNSMQLAAALGCGLHLIAGVKKANAMAAAAGIEPLIFTGRYSTPGQVSDWLDSHRSFVARRVLKGPAQNSGHQDMPQDPAPRAADKSGE